MRKFRIDIFRRLFRKGLVDKKYERSVDRELIEEIQEEIEIEKQIENALADTMMHRLIENEKKLINLKRRGFLD